MLPGPQEQAGTEKDLLTWLHCCWGQASSVSLSKSLHAQQPPRRRIETDAPHHSTLDPSSSYAFDDATCSGKAGLQVYAVGFGPFSIL